MERAQLRAHNPVYTPTDSLNAARPFTASMLATVRDMRQVTNTGGTTATVANTPAAAQ
jgi:hypothetical protein